MTDPRKSILPVLMLTCALLGGPPLLGGCTQSRMTTVWRDPAYDAGTMTKVLAIAVRKDPIRRRLWEDAFVEELKAHGVSGTASYALYPLAIPDSLQVSEVVRTAGYDGVALSVRLPDATRKTYVPGYTKRELATVSGPFLRGYTTYWQDVQVPGYTETNEVRRFQTSVWTTRDGGRMIWSGTNESADVAVRGTVRGVIRKQVGVELVAAGILPPLKR